VAFGVYEVGDTVICTATFTNAGVAIDPATVTFAVVQPDGTSTTYTYPANIARAAPGVYVALWPVAQVGNHSYQFHGAGPSFARTVTRTFLARATKFT
jgi:hypothetical protein